MTAVAGTSTVSPVPSGRRRPDSSGSPRRMTRRRACRRRRRSGRAARRARCPPPGPAAAPPRRRASPSWCGDRRCGRSRRPRRAWPRAPRPWRCCRRPRSRRRLPSSMGSPALAASRNSRTSISSPILRPTWAGRPGAGRHDDVGEALVKEVGDPPDLAAHPDLRAEGEAQGHVAVDVLARDAELGGSRGARCRRATRCARRSSPWRRRA